jgi:hypothetical protein
MEIEMAVKSLVKTYGGEEWFIGVRIPYEEDLIIMYVTCTPDILSLPAAWKKYSLHVMQKNRKNVA